MEVIADIASRQGYFKCSPLGGCAGGGVSAILEMWHLAVVFATGDLMKLLQ